MARPKKDKIEHASLPPTLRSFPHSTLERLSVDPHWSEGLATLFAPLMNDAADDNFKKFVGVWMAQIVQDAPPKALEELFRRILAMKCEHVKPPGEKHLNWKVLRAYGDFVVESGFVPTRSKLKSYLQARGDLALPDDGKGWDRLWEATSLKGLEP